MLKAGRKRWVFFRKDSFLFLIISETTPPEKLWNPANDWNSLKRIPESVIQ